MALWRSLSVKERKTLTIGFGFRFDQTKLDRLPTAFSAEVMVAHDQTPSLPASFLPRFPLYSKAFKQIHENGKLHILRDPIPFRIHCGIWHSIVTIQYNYSSLLVRYRSPLPKDPIEVFLALPASILTVLSNSPIPLPTLPTPS